MGTDSELDLFGARSARDDALHRVHLNAGPWIDRAMAYIAGLREWSGTGEDLRIVIVAALGEPHHHNAWGAFDRTGGEARDD